MGSRVGFSARSVIIPGPDLRLREIRLNYSIFLTIYKPVIANLMYISEGISLNEGGDKKLYGVVRELDAVKLYEEDETDGFKIPEFKEDELVPEEELETKAEEEVPDFNSEMLILLLLFYLTFLFLLI